MQTSQLFKFFMIAFLVLFSSCSLFFDTSPLISHDKKFTARFEKPDWTKVDYPQADIAYQKGRSFLYANSLCPAPKESLEKLALDLFLYEKNISAQKSQDNYLQSEGKIEVERISFSLILTNYKKNNCYYEIVLLHPGEAGPEIQAEYQEFLASFK